MGIPLDFQNQRAAKRTKLLSSPAKVDSKQQGWHPTLSQQQQGPQPSYSYHQQQLSSQPATQYPGHYATEHTASVSPASIAWASLDAVDGWPRNNPLPSTSALDTLTSNLSPPSTHLHQCTSRENLESQPVFQPPQPQPASGAPGLETTQLSTLPGKNRCFSLVNSLLALLLAIKGYIPCLHPWKYYYHSCMTWCREASTP